MKQKRSDLRRKPKTMLKNHNYDLIRALTEKNTGVWRYEREYLKNAEGCEHCTKLWNQLKDDDNKHIDMLVAEIKRHADEGRFD